MNYTHNDLEQLLAFLLSASGATRINPQELNSLGGLIVFKDLPDFE